MFGHQKIVVGGWVCGIRKCSELSVVGAVGVGGG